jgi:hypothetical protein
MAIPTVSPGSNPTMIPLWAFWVLSGFKDKSEPLIPSVLTFL